MNAESHKTKDRSPNFPFIPLELALQRAQQFFSKEKRGAAPFKAAAEHWSYSPNSSGGVQTVAALKNYGLMSDDGSGTQRKLRLTDLALRILLDQRPGSIERVAYIRDAAMMPAVARDVYAQWAGGLPSSATLLHYLVLERSFNNANAHKVVKIIFANHEFAEMNSSSNSYDARELNEDIPSASVAVPNPVTSPPSGSSNFQSFVRAPQDSVVKEERIIAPDADIVIQFSGEPTYATYDFLESYVKLRKMFLKPKDGG